MKVLINTPEIQLPGGVAYYFRSIYDKFQSEIHLFQIGKGGKFFKKVNVIFDYFRYLFNIIFKKYDVYVLSPSLDRKAVFRDLVYTIFLIVFKKKFILYFFGWDTNFQKKIERKYLFIFKKYFFKANRIIVQSKEYSAIFKKWGYSKEIIIETGVVDDILVNYEIISNFEERNSRNILFLARIEKDKGIYEAIKAFEILKREYKEIVLYVAGSGSEMENVKEFVRKNKIKDVNFTGYIVDEGKKELLLKSSIYLFPTFHGEGFPSSIAEAMAFGLPVITRATGGIPDFFENGKMGFITSSKAPYNFAEYMSKLLKNPDLKNEIAAFNIKYAQKHFLASAVAYRLEKIFLNCNTNII